jgi:hypothetical protein
MVMAAASASRKTINQIFTIPGFTINWLIARNIS